MVSIEYQNTPLGERRIDEESSGLLAALRGTGSVDLRTLREIAREYSGFYPTPKEISSLVIDLGTYGFTQEKEGVWRYRAPRTKKWD